MDATSKLRLTNVVQPGSESAIDDLVAWLAARHRKHLILLIGIPASGKSTLAERLKTRGYRTLCLDAIRQELYGDAALQTGLKRVIATFHRRLKAKLRDHERIVVDATSVKYCDRLAVLRKARACGYDITLVVLDVPLAVALERNSKRERVVPPEVIGSLYRELKGRGWPRRREGRLVVLRPGADASHLRLHSVREAQRQKRY